MKIKYSPCASSHNTKIIITSDATLDIDGVPYELSLGDSEWPDIWEQTGGVIIEAHKEQGELFLTVLRRYVESCPWDDGQYHKEPV